jgi:hypothetical protein
MAGSPPLNAFEYAVGTYAPVEFMDLNAGSGTGTESSRLISNLQTTRSIQQKGMNEIQGAVPDERDWLRLWKKKIKETISRFNDSFFDFLIKDSEGKDQETLGKMKHLISRMSNIPSSSGRAYFPELGWDISMNSVVEDIQTELTINLEEFKDSQKKLTRAYAETLKELYVIDARLQEKINKMNQLVDKVQGLLLLEPNKELADLAEPTSAYLAAVLKNNDFSSDFVLFMMTYKRWLAIYDVIQINRVTSSSAIPQCCICTQADVTHAMIPCGHTFCSGCINKQMSLCYICRTSVRDRLKLHFP